MVDTSAILILFNHHQTATALSQRRKIDEGAVKRLVKLQKGQVEIPGAEISRMRKELGK